MMEWGDVPRGLAQGILYEWNKDSDSVVAPGLEYFSSKALVAALAPVMGLSSA